MSREIAPDNFKYRLGQIHEQFDGFYQHDGQEFLALLLDRLHEELNIKVDSELKTIDLPRATSNDGSSGKFKKNSKENV